MVNVITGKIYYIVGSMHERTAPAIRIARVWLMLVTSLGAFSAFTQSNSDRLFELVRDADSRPQKMVHCLRGSVKRWRALRGQ